MSPNKFIQKLLKKLRAKRSDSILGEYGLSDTYVDQMNDLLEKHERYSIDFKADDLEELYNLVHDVEGGYSVEEDVWSFIVKLSKHPLPTSVGIALSKRDFTLTDVISNSNQHLEVYFVAAEKSKYARSRLCIRLFIDEQYSAADLQRYVNLYGSASAVRILQARTPSSEDKYQPFTAEEQTKLKTPIGENEAPAIEKRRKFMKERQDERDRVVKRMK